MSLAYSLFRPPPHKPSPQIKDQISRTNNGVRSRSPCPETQAGAGHRASSPDDLVLRLFKREAPDELWLTGSRTEGPALWALACAEAFRGFAASCVLRGGAASLHTAQSPGPVVCRPAATPPSSPAEGCLRDERRLSSDGQLETVALQAGEFPVQRRLNAVESWLPRTIPQMRSSEAWRAGDRAATSRKRAGVTMGIDASAQG